VAEPVLVEDGDKATLIYSARFARPETLREAIEGLITPEGSAQASPSLNTLIVADRKEIVRSILAVLKEVDRPMQQLLVEARVVEVSLDTDFESELQHLLTVTGSPGSFFQTSDVTLKTPGAAATENQGISINVRPWSSDGKRIDEFIRVLLTRNKAKILSSPNLVVSPGSQASIITGEEVPVQSTQVVAGSLSTTTQFKRVGIKLTVQLHQITNDTARLEINPEVSTVIRFTPAGTGGVTNPVVAIRNVSSTVTMKDGEILTVGGLLSDVDRQIVKGVPLLMDVPGLGLLFQARRHQVVKTQLIFFMRIHIMGEGIPRTTRVYRPGSTMEDVESKTGVVLPEMPKTSSEKKREREERQ
jgi:general secretion pathway protein D